jgi:hypothetical protein
MTHAEQEEILRRALHAIADTIEPAADGLERIRERLSRPRPLVVAWLMAVWTGLAQPLLLRMEPVLAGAAGRLSDRLGEWLRPMIRALRAAVGRLRPAAARLRPLGERLRPAAARLRPLGERLRPAGVLLVNAIRMLRPGSGMSRHEKLRSGLAFGAAALIGAAGGFALSDGLPQSMISTMGSVLGTSAPHNPNSPGPGPRVNGSATRYPSSSGTAPSGTRRPTPTADPTCTPTPKPGADPTATQTSSPTPTQTSSSPTPSQTSSSPTPSQTSSSPTPTQTSSSSPAGPGSTPAGLYPRATVGTGGSTPSATQSPSRVVDRGSGGGRPVVATPSTTAKPAPSSGTSGCG